MSSLHYLYACDEGARTRRLLIVDVDTVGKDPERFFLEDKVGKVSDFFFLPLIYFVFCVMYSNFFMGCSLYRRRNFCYLVSQLMRFSGFVSFRGTQAVCRLPL